MIHRFIFETKLIFLRFMAGSVQIFFLFYLFILLFTILLIRLSLFYLIFSILFAALTFDLSTFLF